MREPVGGIKKIEIDCSVQYSIQDIKKLSIEAMQNEFNENILKNSLIKLANNNEVVFERFTDLNGENCEFWEFARNKLKLKNSQLRLFLLSETRTNTNEGNKIRPPEVPSKNEQISASFSSTSGCGSKLQYSINKGRSSIVSVISEASSVYTGNQKRSSSTYSFRNSNSGSKLRYSISKNDSSIKPLNTKFLRLNSNSDDGKRGQPSTSACEGEETFNVPMIEENDIKFTDTKLGQGAFGCVKLATWNGSEVAVKCLDANDNVKYLIREIKVMDSIRHPNIISIMSVYFTDIYVYIVMEYFKSTTLSRYISEVSTTLDYGIKKNRNYLISLQISKAIAYLHNLSPSILHKDIKPDNILINRELVIKICDLGLSKTSNLSSALQTTVGHHFHGTPMYMAPEILIDMQPATTLSDIWSVACCLVELFSEKTVWEVLPSFSIPNLRRTIMKLKKPKSLEDVPLTIQALLSSCFEREPSKRPNALMLLQLFKRLYKD